MTNDTLINGMPCDWVYVGGGEYDVTIVRGGRENPENHLHVGQEVVFTYCDCDREGVIRSITIKG